MVVSNLEIINVHLFFLKALQWFQKQLHQRLTIWNIEDIITKNKQINKQIKFLPYYIGM